MPKDTIEERVGDLEAFARARAEMGHPARINALEEGQTEHAELIGGRAARDALASVETRVDELHRLGGEGARVIKENADNALELSSKVDAIETRLDQTRQKMAQTLPSIATRLENLMSRGTEESGEIAFLKRDGSDLREKSAAIEKSLGKINDRLTSLEDVVSRQVEQQVEDRNDFTRRLEVVEELLGERSEKMLDAQDEDPGPEFPNLTPRDVTVCLLEALTNDPTIRASVRDCTDTDSTTIERLCAIENRLEKHPRYTTPGLDSMAFTLDELRRLRDTLIGAVVVRGGE